MNEQTNDSKQNSESEPLPWDDDPFAKGPRAMMVLDRMDMDEDQNVLMVTLDVKTLTVESLVQAGNYQNVRACQEHEPQGLRVHIPIYNPSQLVDDATGNVGILTHVHRILARELDDLAFTVASERVDRKVAASDKEAASKARRFDAGKGVVAAKKAGEVL